MEDAQAHDACSASGADPGPLEEERVVGQDDGRGPPAIELPGELVHEASRGSVVAGSGCLVAAEDPIAPVEDGDGAQPERPAVSNRVAATRFFRP